MRCPLSYFSSSSMKGGSRYSPIASHHESAPTTTSAPKPTLVPKPTSLHEHGLEDVIDRFSGDPRLLYPHSTTRERLTPSPGSWNARTIFPDSPLLGWGSNVELPPNEEDIEPANRNIEEESRELDGRFSGTPTFPVASESSTSTSERASERFETILSFFKLFARLAISPPSPSLSFFLL